MPRAAGSGSRPESTVRAVEKRIEEVRKEIDGVELAVQHTLDEKERYVDRHRGRLVKEAAKERQRAVERLQATISAYEAARQDATDAVATERWAATYPSEDADARELQLERTKGGRVPRAIPELRSITSAPQMIEWLRETPAGSQPFSRMSKGSVMSSTRTMRRSGRKATRAGKRLRSRISGSRRA